MSNYNDFINNIILTRGQLQQNREKIYERHHIKPRCVGGTDDAFNLIDLTPREHYVAHMLLAQENPDNAKLVCAWHYMSIINSLASPEEYEASRIAIIKAQGKAVYQISLEGKILSTYYSAREAGRILGVSCTHIVECCNRDRSTAYGYLWQYVQDYNENGLKAKEPKGPLCYKRKVAQYNASNELIQTYDSVRQAMNNTGVDSSSISKCCNGKLKTAGGYIWKYID